MLRLATPVVLIQLGMMSMGVVDTVMVGHLSTVALAAVALGNLYFFVFAVFGMGTLMVLDPVVAQAVGARDEPAIARGIQRGVLLACLLTVPAAVLLALAKHLLALAHQPPEILPLAAAFSVRMAPGVLPFYLFVVFRQSLQAMRHTVPILIAIVLANLLNALLNWVLIFGHLGVPAMGVVGSAWATTASRWVLVAGLLSLSWIHLRAYLRPVRAEIWHLAPLGRMLRLGLPIGSQFVLEFGAFAFVALMMGWLGTRQMAGHQVAINLASLTFMVPLGVADAASVLVGHAVGRRDPAGARGAAWAALTCGASFMAMTGLLFLTLPGPLARLYSQDSGVITVAVLLIRVAGVFQVFDGLQAVAGGILRGLGQTRVAMTGNLLGYWLVGLPVSYYLCFIAGWGPVGLWWGLVLGLGLVAAFLLTRVRLGLGRQQQRVMIDPVPPPAALDRSVPSVP
ncbi:MAG TPA: MATE family efflux transporter [Gemmatimonadales bacterium]|nr:MATE family efflux transporter [Gemmatimonadales bacterium]